MSPPSVVTIDEPPPIPLSAAGRPIRPRALPKRYRQFSPPRNVQQPEPDRDVDVVLQEDVHCESDPQNPLYDTYRSIRDKFGLQKIFRRQRRITVADNATDSEEDHHPNPFHPLPNYSTYRMFKWFFTISATKSFADFKRLQTILGDPHFRSEDFADVDLSALQRRLADSTVDDDGWITSTATISVPLGHLSDGAPNSAEFHVEGFKYRPLVSVVRSILKREVSARFCYEPYQLRYTPPGSTVDMAVHGEMYWGKAFRDAYDEIQRLPRREGDTLARTVIALLFYSDSMMAAKFGDAKLWPAYLQVGNQSKRERCRPGQGATHLIALIPSVRRSCLTLVFCLMRRWKLPKSFKGFVTRMTRGKKVTPELVAHCRRELIQACWRIMLDDDFIQAWSNGVVQLCRDAVERRWYPRILAYVGDLPEKYVDLFA